MARNRAELHYSMEHHAGKPLSIPKQDRPRLCVG